MAQHSKYTSITVIYNPHSTGPGKRMAERFKEQLESNVPKSQGYTVSIVATKHKGHAEALAYDLAKATKHPLIISSSGDGGYHEVVNGALRAQSEGAKPTIGLLPAGNANDHFHSLHAGDDLVVSVLKGKAYAVDALKLSATSGGKAFERHAHSYIGIGLTPHVGKELNRHNLNRFTEMWLTFKVFMALRPVHLLVDGVPSTFYSLIFSNVRRMGKFLTISQIADASDGKFEITRFAYGTKRHLLGHFLKGVLLGFKNSEQAKTFSFQTTKRTLIQLDGEVVRIDADSSAEITTVAKAIRCVI